MKTSENMICFSPPISLSLRRFSSFKELVDCTLIDDQKSNVQMPQLCPIRITEREFSRSTANYDSEPATPKPAFIRHQSSSKESDDSLGAKIYEKVSHSTSARKCMLRYVERTASPVILKITPLLRGKTALLMSSKGSQMLTTSIYDPTRLSCSTGSCHLSLYHQLWPVLPILDIGYTALSAHSIPWAKCFRWPGSSSLLKHLLRSHSCSTRYIPFLLSAAETGQS